MEGTDRWGRRKMTAGHPSALAGVSVSPNASAFNSGARTKARHMRGTPRFFPSATQPCRVPTLANSGWVGRQNGFTNRPRTHHIRSGERPGPGGAV
jgi:hypothetical protein